MQTRTFIHDENHNHFDIEALFPVRDENGLWSDVWAVIWCSEESGIDEDKVAQAQQEESTANYPSRYISDLSPVMETANTTLEERG